MGHPLVCQIRKLNVRAIKALKTRDRSYKAADGEGLYIEVTPAGGKLWRLAFKFEGKDAVLVDYQDYH